MQRLFILLFSTRSFRVFSPPVLEKQTDKKNLLYWRAISSFQWWKSQFQKLHCKLLNLDHLSVSMLANIYTAAVIQACFRSGAHLIQMLLGFSHRTREKIGSKRLGNYIWIPVLFHYQWPLSKRNWRMHFEGVREAILKGFWKRLCYRKLLHWQKDIMEPNNQ